MRRNMMGLVLMFACSTTAWAQVEKGLVAHWDFDEGKGDVLHDRSGNKNHGKIHGAKWIKSGKGYALRFDGANNYVDCGTGPSLDITGPITLQAWIQPTAVNQGEPGIVGKFFESYAITYYGPIHWYISSGGNKVYGTANIGSWTHVAATFDGTTMRIFLNGDEAMSRKSNFNKMSKIEFSHLDQIINTLGNGLRIGFGDISTSVNAPLNRGQAINLEVFQGISYSDPAHLKLVN